MGHACLYVCLPLSKARTNLQARKKVYQYLVDEGFEPLTRFGGCADYFSVGRHGRATLNLLRLKHKEPQKFKHFWRQLDRLRLPKERAALFRKTFPDYRGKIPFDRERCGGFGHADDAQIMDEELFRQLKRGFSKNVNYSYEFDDPNVIFTDVPGDDDQFPKTVAEAAKFWVVVIDYHS